MAEKRGKFAALALLREPQELPETAAEHAPVSQPVVQEAARAKGRPATGKRSNPEWKLYSHFLKRRTQRQAVARLQAEDNGRDLSDVLQELLENWLNA